ncbi:hypothetical protein FCIRC_9903 [Fusarium circinatum]|uniref:Azaphilone pigments biosynthesis cluster protein L N-terminal domain-containing protein n=1 Tax=Fusarium circinatum TaxID=48490 RepID=A0A8H5TD08_FUSCI|nr:hypothetical protein FCIRC_9903 [Fusarium circinatum]
MADLVGTVIAVATVAFESSQALFNFIDGIQNATRTFTDLQADVSAVQRLLLSLKTILEGKSVSDLSRRLKECLESLILPMKSCAKSNNELRQKLEKIRPSDKNGKATILEGIKLQYHEKDISIFKRCLASHKATITAALGLANFMLLKENQDTVQELTQLVLAATSRIKGQLDGFEIAMLAFPDLDKHNETAYRALQEQTDIFQKCTKVCDAAMEELRGRSNRAIGRVELFDESLQITLNSIGEMTVTGQPPTADSVILHNQTKQMMAGSVVTKSPADVIRGFFYNHYEMAWQRLFRTESELVANQSEISGTLSICCNEFFNPIVYDTKNDRGEYGIGAFKFTNEELKLLKGSDLKAKVAFDKSKGGNISTQQQMLFLAHDFPFILYSIGYGLSINFKSRLFNMDKMQCWFAFFLPFLSEVLSPFGSNTR